MAQSQSPLFFPARLTASEAVAILRSRCCMMGVSGGTARSSPRKYSEGEQSAVQREKRPQTTQIWGSLQKTAEKFNPGALTKSQN